MLLIPNTNATPEIIAIRGFNTISHVIANAITATSKKGKARLKKEMNHHVPGLRDDAKQDSKKKITTAMLV